MVCDVPDRVFGRDTLTFNAAPVYNLRMQNISFKRHRFPPEIIRHAVWLYARFTMSFRDVEDLLADAVWTFPMRPTAQEMVFGDLNFRFLTWNFGVGHLLPQGKPAVPHDAVLPCFHQVTAKTEYVVNGPMYR